MALSDRARTRGELVSGGLVFATRVGPWFRWFAWHPVCTLDRGWRWLIPVWRARYQSKLSLPGPIRLWFVHAVDKDWIKPPSPQRTKASGEGS